MAGLFAAVSAAQQPTALDPAAFRTAIERGLRRAPRRFEPLLAPSQTGVRLVNIDVARTGPRAQRVTIDLSQKTLTYDPSGNVDALHDERFTRVVARAIRDALLAWAALDD
ncbi:MAG: hypothetical protein HYU37_15225 [Acidobacteria bacterium]|nr:hypothetical protein [Acidobacteriota bacterium]